LASQPVVAGLGGICGVNLSELSTLLKAYRVPESEWQTTIDLIMALSKVAIKHWNVVSDQADAKNGNKSQIGTSDG
jgi:hypothetical protein